MTGDTALCTAITGKATCKVQLLLENGADINRSGWRGFTPLHTAIESGDSLLVEKLLSLGADPYCVSSGSTNLIHKVASR